MVVYSGRGLDILCVHYSVAFCLFTLILASCIRVMTIQTPQVHPGRSRSTHLLTPLHMNNCCHTLHSVVSIHGQLGQHPALADISQ